MIQQPKISCLCVTNNRAEQLSRAIDCFFSQTYPEKELVVVYQEDDFSTKQLLKGIDDSRIKAVNVSSKKKMSLGALRNLSIKKATGAYICLWDDDDWYHSRRLELQFRAISESNKPGCVLIFLLLFNQVESKAYLSAPGPVEGSIMVQKSVLKGVRYADQDSGEDTPFVYSLMQEKLIYALIDPSLYIYIYTGNNTWNQNHFDRMFSIADPLNDETSKAIKEILNEGSTKSSALLRNEKILEKLDYFHWWRPILKQYSEKDKVAKSSSTSPIESQH